MLTWERVGVSINEGDMRGTVSGPDACQLLQIDPFQLTLFRDVNHYVFATLKPMSHFYLGPRGPSYAPVSYRRFRAGASSPARGTACSVTSSDALRVHSSIVEIWCVRGVWNLDGALLLRYDREVMLRDVGRGLLAIKCCLGMGWSVGVVRVQECKRCRVC